MLEQPQDQPARDNIEQCDLEDVAPPEFGKQGHGSILTQQPFAAIQAGTNPGQDDTDDQRTRR